MIFGENLGDFCAGEEKIPLDRTEDIAYYLSDLSAKG